MCVSGLGASAWAQQGFLEVFDSGESGEFPVYDKANPNPEKDVPVLFLKPGDILPEGKLNGNRYVIERKGGSPLYVPARFVRPSKGADRRRLHLDGQLGTPYTLTSIPGKTYQDCWDIESKKDADVPCKAWPTAGDNTANLEFEGSELVRFYDPLEGREVTRIFYKVNGTYLPKKRDANGKAYFDSQARGFSGLWIDSKNIRYTPLGRSVDLSQCAPLFRESPQGLLRGRKALDDIASDIAENLYSNLIPHVGKCISGNGGVPALRQHWRQRNRQSGASSLTLGGAKVTHQQLEAIDVLARVLFGEMRSCTNIGLQYPMAVAKVALNRAEHARKRKPDGSLFPLPSKRGLTGVPVEESLVKILGTPLQFSALNQDDSNLAKVMCPVVPRKRKGPDPSIEAWKKSVKVAAMAILDAKDFKEKTKSVSVFHYTSAIPAPWKGAQRVSASIDGYGVDNASCIRLWKLKSAHAQWIGPEVNWQNLVGIHEVNF